MVEIVKKGEVAHKISDFLSKMNLRYNHDEKNNNFAVHFDIKFGEEILHFQVFVFYSKDWISIVAPLIRENDLPKEVDKLEFYKKLLRETYYLNEVTYGLTKNDDVVVHAESATQALDFENFKIEFYSVIYGIEHFLNEVIPSVFAAGE